ncbi:hypothetical protein Q8A73_013270 [Channa argus]|nr:hypothetical protein Q8A73_013270 [Channa argus]
MCASPIPLPFTSSSSHHLILSQSPLPALYTFPPVISVASYHGGCMDNSCSNAWPIFRPFYSHPLSLNAPQCLEGRFMEESAAEKAGGRVVSSGAVSRSEELCEGQMEEEIRRRMKAL